MGDPRRIRNKYSRPRSPWQRDRIELEKALLKEYGLKNKTEIWKLDSKLKAFKDLAKKLIAARTAQSEKERAQLLSRLNRLGLIKEGAHLDDVLGLTLKDVLERRLQTLVFRKGLSRTMRQARQFITHQHVAIGKKIISTPSYLVSTSEEPGITFLPKSALSSAEHPERVPKQKPLEKTEEKPAIEAGKA